MTNLLKIAGITANKKASGIKVDEHGRIELSRTVEPKRIIGNVLEPYAEDYKGPISVFGLELYAINGEYNAEEYTHIKPAPDGWLMITNGALLRYDSKGSVIWEAEGRKGKGNSEWERVSAIHGGYVYSVSRLKEGVTSSYVIDKLSYKTGKVVMAGGTVNGISAPTDLVYAANIDRLIGVASYADNTLKLMYIHPETLQVEYSVDTVSSKISAIFGVGVIKGFTFLSYENGEVYIHVDTLGVVTAKLNADINVTVQNLVKKFVNATTVSAGFVLNGDVYSEQYGTYGRLIFRNGVAIHTKETDKKSFIFRGGSTGNLALMADGNKVLAFDKDKLVMSVEIPHEVLIMSISGDSMGNIFVGTDVGIYILGDTLQIKGYQLVV